VRVLVLDLLDKSTDFVAHALGLGREVDGLGPSYALAVQVGRIRGGSVGVEQRAQDRGATQEQMCVVLPRHTDAAVDLNVEVGAVVGRRRRERGSRSGREG